MPTIRGKGQIKILTVLVFIIYGLLVKAAPAETRHPNEECPTICGFIVVIGGVFCDSPGDESHRACMAFFYEK